MTERSGEERRVFKIVVEQTRCGDATRSWRVINERDSQDFTVVFVKRSRYHHRHQRGMVEISARSVGAPASGMSLVAAPAPLERFAVTVIPPFGSLISRRD